MTQPSDVAAATTELEVSMTDTSLSSPVSPVQRNPFVALLAVLLSAVDRLAGWWLDWRMTRALAADPELSKMGFHKAAATQTGCEIEAISPAVPILADQCARLMTQAGAQNYVEFELLPRLDRGLRPVVITVRWSNGELPSVKAARFEAELSRINTALAHCGIVGIADEFHDAADAITQMADHIRALEQTWNQLGEPEDYADHDVSADESGVAP